MPPHHHKKHKDKYWADMPAKAQEAAKCMGYTKETWDKDEKIPYDSTVPSELSEKKKAAAMYLGIKVLDTPVCNVWWESLGETEKKNAEIIGFDKHKWDHDWNIKDLPIEHKYWKELSEEERGAARFFGYTPPLWDEVEDEADVPFYDGSDNSDPKPSKKPSKNQKVEECVDDEEEWTDDEEDGAQEQSAPSKGSTNGQSSGNKKKKPVKTSRFFGGSDGNKFRTGNVRHIDKLTIHSDRHVVHGVEITCGRRMMAGTKDGKEHEFVLAKGEFIVKAEVRASDRSVQCLTFHTNKGRELGPCGGKGWLVGKDRCGEESTVQAPMKYQLAGFQGTADDNHLTSIAFSWGSVSSTKNKN